MPQSDSTERSAEACRAWSYCRPGTYLGGERWVALIDLAQAVEHFGQL